MPSEIRTIRVMVHICDGCGRKYVTPPGVLPDGFFFQNLQIEGDRNINSESYACSTECVQLAQTNGVYYLSWSEADKRQSIEQLEKNSPHYIDEQKLVEDLMLRPLTVKPSPRPRVENAGS